MPETVIVDMTFGSHLYGTAGPESDLDFKGIYLPAPEELLLGRIPKSVNRGKAPDNTAKNEPGDVDHEVYSLHYFLELALKGETVALDMLHAPASALRVSSLCWRSLRSNRRGFYTRNLRSLVGYARRQAAKYGVKGSRLAEARAVLAVLEAAGDQRVGELALPEDLEHGGWERVPDDADAVRCFSICGKLFQETARASHYVPTLRRFVEEYGERARQAERSEGVDWKAMSHALRAGYQTRLILTDCGFEYPLPETDYLVAVKRGERPFPEVRDHLEELIDEVEALSRLSPYPEQPDRDWWESWLLSWVGRLTGFYCVEGEPPWSE